VRVGGVFAKEPKVWRVMLDDAVWANIKEVCGGVDGFDPEFCREIGLDKKRLNNVVSGAERSLGFSVWQRGVWTREAESDAIGREKGTEIMVNKLAAIVILNTTNDYIKLSFDKGKETLQGGRGVRFIA
jgi:hypothetical protein